MPRIKRVPIELEICEDSPTNYHHFKLTDPDGSKVYIGICKYCGDHKVHYASEVGYNNRITWVHPEQKSKLQEKMQQDRDKGVLT
tara:strand:+ start:225 stop:479 length:255 start_codon:yes stop_codon:yes gene_type:complete